MTREEAREAVRARIAARFSGVLPPYVRPTPRAKPVQRPERARGPERPEPTSMLLRPRTRGDCVDGERPCPFVSCRYHLALDVTSAGTVVLYADPEALDEMLETCALDVADRGEHTLEEIGDVCAVSRERIRQIQVIALEQLRPYFEAVGIDEDVLPLLGRPVSPLAQAQEEATDLLGTSAAVHEAPEPAAVRRLTGAHREFAISERSLQRGGGKADAKGGT